MKSYARMLAAMAVGVSLTPALFLHAQGTVKPYSGEIDSPKVELFLGYTHFGTASTKTVAGNRMVGLNGGSASVAFNLNRYLGLVADIGGYNDNAVQLTGTGVNQPLDTYASGTVYSFLGGPRLSFRNYSRFTPFAQAFFGGVYAGAVTVSNCSGSACTVLPSQKTLSMTAGGGLDIRLVHHISLRAVQAEYMMTRFGALTTGASTSQNDLRLSTGLVFRFGDKTVSFPMQLACSVQPSSAFSGDSLAVTSNASNLNPKRKAVYTWTTTSGKISSTNSSGTIDTTGLAPGDYTVSGHLSQGDRPSQQASCSTSFTIRAYDPPTVSCSADPASVTMGGVSTITANGISPQNRPLTYSYTSSAGQISGNIQTAALNTAGAAPGDISVTCNVVDDLGKSASATTTVTVQSPPAPPPPLAVEAKTLCSLSFERDRKRPVRVDNEAKACLDDIALSLNRDSSAHLVIVGDYSSDEKPSAGEKRALDVKQYLTGEKGIDASRIEVRTGTASGRTVTDTIVPIGASY